MLHKWDGPYKLTKAMKEALADALLYGKGKLFIHSLMPSPQEEGRNRTIYALEERGLVRHLPREGGWSCYAHGLTPKGLKLACEFANARVTELERKLSRAEAETNRLRLSAKEGH